MRLRGKVVADKAYIPNPTLRNRPKYKGGRHNRDGIKHADRQVCYNYSCSEPLTDDRNDNAINAGLCKQCWNEYQLNKYHERQDSNTDELLTDSEYNLLISNKARRMALLDGGMDDKLYNIMVERGIIQPDEDRKNLSVEDQIKLIKQISPEINESLLRLALKVTVGPPTSDKDTNKDS